MSLVELEKMRSVNEDYGKNCTPTEKELKKHCKNLERQVKEQAAEIEEMNAELDRLNDLFVYREFRIKELKDKVKQLENILAGK